MLLRGRMLCINEWTEARTHGQRVLRREYRCDEKYQDRDERGDLETDTGEVRISTCLPLPRLKSAYVEVRVATWYRPPNF